MTAGLAIILFLAALAPLPALLLDTDATLLLAFKYAVTADPLAALSSWRYEDESACAWNGVMCMGFPFADAAGNGTSISRVISLVLPGAQLSGTLPPELGLIEHLRHLDLSDNALNGTLPETLFNASEMRVLSLAGNAFSGAVPGLSPTKAASLQVLNLSDNALTGGFPAGLQALPAIVVVSLANNSLSGSLPGGGFDKVDYLDISGNEFNGTLPPDFVGGSALYLNASSNRLAGRIPAALAGRMPANATVDFSENNFTGSIPQSGAFPAQQAEAYAGNPGLCGRPLAQMCSIPSTRSDPPNGTVAVQPDSPPAFAAIPKNVMNGDPPTQPRQEGGLRPSAILAICFGDAAGVALVFMVLLYVCHARKRRKELEGGKELRPKQQKTVDAAGVEVGSSEEAKLPSSPCLPCCGRSTSGRSDVAGSSASSETEDDGDAEAKKQMVLQPASVAPTLVILDGEDIGVELETETLLKASAYILGSSGTSIVYKAVLADGTALAVRRIGESAGGVDRLKDFDALVRVVARFRHPNILRLRGFFWGSDEKLLIHDYAPKGSLAGISVNKRIGMSPTPLPLNWDARLRIARGVARGLAYLHEKKAVHGNVKPSNILLTEDCEPLIGDFGLDRVLLAENAGYRHGASSRHFGSKRSMHSTSSLPDTPQMMPGASPSAAGASASASTLTAMAYQAPEALKNLKPSAKWDVYSFGMLLLELVSGRVLTEIELCQWQSGLVDDEERIRALRMADPALRGDGEGKEDALLSWFKLGLACCAAAPQKRPSMKDALQVLDRVPSSSTFGP